MSGSTGQREREREKSEREKALGVGCRVWRCIVLRCL